MAASKNKVGGVPLEILACPNTARSAPQRDAFRIPSVRTWVSLFAKQSVDDDKSSIAQLFGPIRQVMVRGIKNVDQLFVLTMAGYNLMRMRTLAAVRPLAE